MTRPMKDSGIEWIGAIPEEWEYARIKNYAAINSGLYVSKDEYDDNGVYPVVGSNGEIGRIHKCNNNKEVIITGRVGTLGTAHIIKDAWITDNALILDISGMDIKYLCYVIPNFDFDYLTTGTAQPLITATKLKNQYSPLPPLNEQSRIAAFLDEKCAAIDALIDQTHASIEEYKKLKQAVITQAVTKGIRPGRKMKDSGVEWVGEIPEEWESINPKALFSQRKEKAKNGERQLTASQQYGVIYQDEYMEKTGAKVVTVEKDFDILKHVEAGDFVISMRSFQGGLEYSTNTGSISSAYVMLIPSLKLVFPRYYRWLLKSSVYINALQCTSNMVRDGQAMRYSNFIQVRLFTVPLDEQEEIANYLDEKCAAIDAMIDKKEQLVSELESYKKSLIFEYVTGKKEVPA